MIVNKPDKHAVNHLTKQYLENLLCAARSQRVAGVPRTDVDVPEWEQILLLAQQAAPSLPGPLPRRERPLVCFDLETTGTEPATDRIIQIAGMIVEPDDRTTEFNQLVNPGRPIPPKVTELTGITDAMVATAPPFAEEARRWVWDTFQGCDLLGFNSSNFDVPLLWEEFHRAGYAWNLFDVRQVDVGVLFKQLHRRRLLDAVAVYLGQKRAAAFELQAHDALADVRATLDVFRSLRGCHAEAGGTLDELHRLSTEQELDGQKVQRVDLAGVLVRDEAGDVRYTHKRVRGVKLGDGPGYARWLLGADFSANTKQAVRDELRRLQERAAGGEVKDVHP